MSIRFPKSILEHASCIKHIEVKGSLDVFTASQSGRSLYSQAASGQFSAATSAHGYNLRSGSVGGQGQYPGNGGSGVGGQGQYPGGSGVGGQGQYPGGSGVGGQGQYPGGSGVGGQGQYPGGQGQYPGGSGVGGQGQYPGGSGVGGQGQYPGGSGVGGQGQYPGWQGRPDYNPDNLYPDHTHSQGWHGRPPFNHPGPGQSHHGRFKRYVTPGPSTTTGRPPIAGPPTTTTARPPYVSGQPSVTVSPPFLLDVIEILVTNVEPCKPYKFNLKVISPQGSTLGEIDNLILPPLPEMAEYHPPPLGRLFKVQLQGPGQPPQITLQPGNSKLDPSIAIMKHGQLNHITHQGKFSNYSEQRWV